MKLFQNVMPTRVVVDDEGYAVSPKQARAQYGVTVIHTVFVRDDGWSVGAPEAFVDVAYNLWPDNWESFVQGGVSRPIAAYGQ